MQKHVQLRFLWLIYWKYSWNVTQQISKTSYFSDEVGMRLVNLFTAGDVQGYFKKFVTQLRLSGTANQINYKNQQLPAATGK